MNISADIHERPDTTACEHTKNSPKTSTKPRILPSCLKIKQDAIHRYTPDELFRHFKDRAPFILESAYGEDKTAKYSLIGLNPVVRVKAEGENLTVISGRNRYTRIVASLFADEKLSTAAGSPVHGMKEKTKPESIPDSVLEKFGGNSHSIGDDTETLFVTDNDPVTNIHGIVNLFDYGDVGIPGYQGGLTGYFSYDLVYSLFRTVSTDKPETPFPIADFIMTSEYILFDHPANDIYIVSLALVTGDEDVRKSRESAEKKVASLSEEIQTFARERIKAAEQQGDGDTASDIAVPAKPVENPPPAYTENIPKQRFEDLVRTTKEYIYSGDIFQGVISKRNECAYDDDPFLIYAALKKVNPGPYMYYIDYGERQIIGSSPEMLVKVEQNRVTTVPIAGTRPRGKTPGEDRELGDELLADEKECAEHIMLVDLARNDIGRACEYGTVTMDAFMMLEKFSHVQHIVSKVSGELRENTGPAEAFKSIFPAGTLTGAPKIRAMQIIDELETDRRGLYGGAVGHIGLDNKTDFAIAIRTLVCENKELSFQAGAGIVADSDPETEYEEAEKKASAMVQAISIAQGGRFS